MYEKMIIISSRACTTTCSLPSVRRVHRFITCRSYLGRKHSPNLSSVLMVCMLMKSMTFAWAVQH